MRWRSKSSKCLLYSCIFKSSLREFLNAQNLHLYGFSPVWVSKCLRKWGAVVNVLQQIWQEMAALFTFDLLSGIFVTTSGADLVSSQKPVNIQNEKVVKYIYKPLQWVECLQATTMSKMLTSSYKATMFTSTYSVEKYNIFQSLITRTYCTTFL